MFSCNSPQKFQTIYLVIHREITFLGKITEIVISSKLAVGDKFQICCHNHNADACMFFNSSINSMKEVDG